LPTAPLFWHLYTYESRSVAQAIKGPNETILESLGKVWLTTVAPAGWKPSGGERVAEIGPLPVIAGETYLAQYMEAVFPPGFDTPVHRHPGPEAWYTVAGEVCLETPGRKAVVRAGDKNGVIVPGGQPMRLSVIGTEERRSLVLILHESSKPHTAPASDWKPDGLCKH
jgi:quercetin dioxygenase-like cupin family protein